VRRVRLPPVRIVGLSVAAAGLAIFAAGVIAAAVFQRVFYLPVWMTGVVLVCLGCLLLIAYLAFAYRKAPPVTLEVVVAFLMIIVGLFFLFAFFGDEGGIELLWLIPTILLLPGAVAIVCLATLAKRERERWRNKE
jgi:hypothetical protein